MHRLCCYYGCCAALWLGIGHWLVGTCSPHQSGLADQGSSVQQRESKDVGNVYMSLIPNYKGSPRTRDLNPNY